MGGFTFERFNPRPEFFSEPPDFAAMCATFDDDDLCSFDVMFNTKRGLRYVVTFYLSEDNQMWRINQLWFVMAHDLGWKLGNKAAIILDQSWSRMKVEKRRMPAVITEHPNRCMGCGAIKRTAEWACHECRPQACQAYFLGDCSGVCEFEEDACDYIEYGFERNKHELCVNCDDYTGRAGRCDDSLFDVKGGGPYCENCFEQLTPYMRGEQAPEKGGDDA